jgi:hypothetical protein
LKKILFLFYLLFTFTNLEAYISNKDNKNYCSEYLINFMLDTNEREIFKDFKDDVFYNKHFLKIRKFNFNRYLKLQKYAHNIVYNNPENEKQAIEYLTLLKENEKDYMKYGLLKRGEKYPYLIDNESYWLVLKYLVFIKNYKIF